jgi:hypothetical protein
MMNQVAKFSDIVLLIAFLVALLLVMSLGYGATPEIRLPFHRDCSGSMNVPCDKALTGFGLNFTDQNNLGNGSVVIYEVRLENRGTWIWNSTRKRNSRFVMHRIVDKKNGCYFLKGDNNEDMDDICVKPAQIVARIRE